LMADKFDYTNIVIATTTLLKTGSGVLHSIIVNQKWAGGTAVIYDNTEASGTKIGTVDVSTVGTRLMYDVEFNTGLTIQAIGLGTPSITIMYA
jgi:hypothetical protein